MTIENHEERSTLSLADFRQKVANKKGREYWRSLNELAHREDFEELVRQEFPRQASLLGDLSRRDFLKFLGASLALAGVTACTPQSPAKILPYVKPPEQLIPGKSMYFASTMVQDGYGKGVLVETTMGRPIKIEGNPNHPDSLGATDIFMQASVLELYDPDRLQQLTQGGATKTWADFTAAAGGLAQAGGMRLLTSPVTSPSLAAQIQAFVDDHPQVVWHQFSPVGRANTLAGAQLAYGQPLERVLNLANASVILALDCDFLFSEPGHLRYAREFAAHHQPDAQGGMSRLYAVEGSLSLTGMNSDHHLAIKPSQVEAFARALAAKLGVAGVTAPTGEVPGQEWLDPLAADLRQAGAGALVVAGERQPAVVHALAYAINEAVGAVGSTLTLIPAVEAAPVDPNASLRQLTDDLNAGQVQTVVILGGNPVYTAPADLNFAAALQKAQNRIYLGYYPDETAALATWVIPAAHDLEHWGDARAYDGATSVVQPVIEPLFGGKAASEVLAALSGQADAKSYDLVRAYWQTQLTEGDFDRNWRAALSKGMLPNTMVQAAVLPTLTDPAGWPAGPAPAEGLEMVFEPDNTVWDGRFSNISWLQELPKSLSKLTWDNAVLLSPTTAERLGVQSNDVVTLALDGRTLEAAAFVQPGQPNDVATLSLGYGRKAGGSLASGPGFNAYALRTSAAPWFSGGLQVTPAGRTYDLVTTQEHWTMEDRELVREATLEEYQAHPNFAQEEEGEQASLYPAHEYPTYAWGMAINLSACIGCNACTIACQAENNIPTVGKQQVKANREMHWIRVDRYYRGPVTKPQFAFQPVPCMHCENAPCEPVCPVEATSHSAEGINEMTYNRCVGTRYCSNNCPYKVRRFNFFKYAEDTSPILKALRNPDVSVRSRGVMEKCTFCVQRVNEVRITAEAENRQIRDGEVVTACQQACPASAIVFGDINNPDSAVRKAKDSARNYALLGELGTRPRTTYLAKVRNPNPSIPESVEG
jgi:molybdopterin-containing oxidoreductase family iron-sulfur binding subunit